MRWMAASWPSKRLVAVMKRSGAGRSGRLGVSFWVIVDIENAPQDLLATVLNRLPKLTPLSLRETPGEG